jgi:proteasome lid subunit RPN8/RPN11
MTGFVIARPVFEQMLRHVEADPEREVCGLLGGRDERASVAVAISNASPTPAIRYEMDRQQMVEAIIQLRKEHMDVVGVYHSHPRDPATPSATDIAEATWPDVVYVIIGRDMGRWVARGWSLRHGEAHEVGLNIHEDAAP